MCNKTQTKRQKVLIANRGEIAVRIIRACKDYGLDSIAIYADADADALFVQMATQAWSLHGDNPADSYLNIEKILHIARQAGASMVHPGYGFLSERADFARAVQAAGLIWIGPSPHTIEQLGDKVQARKIALAAGAPLVKGTADPVSNADEVYQFAKTHGLPVAIKAAFGGGGRGLKVAWQLDEINALYQSAVREATAAFGRGECYVEQYLDRPRHIEAQVIADTFGKLVVLGTRDCSLQRRNQKLLEEAPAPFISEAQRQTIHAAARDICARAGYVGAGTVEFLLSRDGKLSFLEVNTRLQVEHPVTEETTGIDLVVEQLRIAQGLPLSISTPPAPRGHSIEFRINAEDVGRGFLPVPGRITRFIPPSGPGIRLDTGVGDGALVPGNYDSMLAKLIVSGATRQQAIARARRALAEFVIDGVPTVLPFHQAVLNEADFVQDFQVHTRWIETEFAGHISMAPRQLPHTEQPVLRSWIEINGQRMTLALPAGLFSIPMPGIHHANSHPPGAQLAKPYHEQQNERQSERQSGQQENSIMAPVSGVLHSWQAADGARVRQGEVIAVMEAMKMEVQVIAPQSGALKQMAATGSIAESGEIIGIITEPTPAEN